MTMLTTSDGVGLHVEEAGEGPPLLILPGWGVSAWWFREQFAARLTSQFRVICYDPRGQGESEKTERGQRVGRMAADLAEVIEHIDEPRVNLVAWSGGGSTALHYIELFGTQRLESLTLIGAGPKLLKSPEWDHGFLELTEATAWVDLIRHDFDAAVRGLAPQFFARHPGDEFLEAAIRDMLKCHPAGMSRASWDFLNGDFRDMLDQVDVPTLVVTGEQDTSVPAGNAPYLHEKISGSQLTVIGDAAHCPFLEQPDQFNSALVDFLKTKQVEPYRRAAHR
ncbi:alpha/beta fold hydrolase [Prauserella oleivorans]|uniref:Alpha/beta fold hydrolase n=1 Tax=Prauserella oleivorans TaxID=1478153 RepID=A0ABW5WEZ4_9PSEU